MKRLFLKNLKDYKTIYQQFYSFAIEKLRMQNLREKFLRPGRSRTIKKSSLGLSWAYYSGIHKSEVLP